MLEFVGWLLIHCPFHILIKTFFFIIKLLSRRYFIISGKDLKSYAKALQQPHGKHFSSQGSGDKRHPHAIVLLDENADGKFKADLFFQILKLYFIIMIGTTVWPDPSLGLLGPKDLRMPLPGNVGFSHRLSPSVSPATVQSTKKTWHDTELFSTLTNYERQYQVVKQSAQEDLDELNSTEIEELLLDLPQPSDVLECVAQACPKLVRKGKNKQLSQ